MTYVDVPIGEDGETITFEVGPDDAVTEHGLVSDRGGHQVGRATRTLEASLGPIQSFMGTVVTKLRETDLAPAQLRVDVSLKFAGEMGFVVARGNAEASVMVSATWSSTPLPGPGPAPAPRRGGPR
jgi:hypothetical protein